MIALSKDAASGRYAVELLAEDGRYLSFVLTPDESPEVERLLGTPVRDWFALDADRIDLPSVKRHAVPWFYLVAAAIARERGELAVLDAVMRGLAERTLLPALRDADLRPLGARVRGQPLEEALALVAEYAEVPGGRTTAIVADFLARLDDELPALLERG